MGDVSECNCKAVPQFATREIASPTPTVNSCLKPDT